MTQRPAHTGYPRGSEFYIYSNCDISFELMQKSGEEPATVFAEKGTRLHAAWAGRLAPSALESQELDDYQDGMDRYQLALRTWLGGEEQPHLQLVEHRFWMREGFRPIYSGQPDKVLVLKERGFIPDFKSGWHPPDAINATNSQLRAYVPLVTTEVEGLEEITVKIIKPGKQDPAAIFDAQAIRDATAWALDVVGRITSPNEKKPNRGAWCQYCSGKVLCPLWRDELKTLALTSLDAIEQLPDGFLRELGPRLNIAKKVIARLEAWLEKRVREAPELFPEWRIDPGDPRRKVIDLAKAFERLHKEGVTAEEFLSSCSTAITELEKIFKKRKGLKGISATLEFEKVMGDAIERQRTRDKLVYIPAIPEGNGKANEEPDQVEAQLPFL
jgi:hypothetical protein